MSAYRLARERRRYQLGTKRIARALGTTPQNVWHIERKALAKFRRAWKRIVGSEPPC